MLGVLRCRYSVRRMTRAAFVTSPIVQGPIAMLWSSRKVTLSRAFALADGARRVADPVACPLLSVRVAPSSYGYAVVGSPAGLGNPS